MLPSITVFTAATDAVVGSVSVAPDAVSAGMAIVALVLAIAAAAIVWELAPCQSSEHGAGGAPRRVRVPRTRSPHWANAFGSLR